MLNRGDQPVTEVRGGSMRSEVSWSEGCCWGWASDNLVQLQRVTMSSFKSDNARQLQRVILWSCREDWQCRAWQHQATQNSMSDNVKLREKKWQCWASKSGNVKLEKKSDNVWQLQKVTTSSLKKGETMLSLKEWQCKATKKVKKKWSSKQWQCQASPPSSPTPPSLQQCEASRVTISSLKEWP